MANPAQQSMPVGYRFRPTDEELISHYLTNKLIGQNFVLQIIPVIDLCKFDPWHLPAFSKINSGDPEWFFFCPRVYKYSKKKRADRATPCGFWKVTGTDRYIKKRGTNEVIGTKKTLVFYRGRVPDAAKTNWVIHEYQAKAFPDEQGSFVLCKLKKKLDEAEGRTDCDEGEPSVAPNSEGRIPDVHSSPSNNVDSFFQTPPADEVDLSSLLFSSMVNEHGSSFQFSPTLNSTGNDFGSVSLPLTTEEEDNADKFVNSIFNLPLETTEEENNADKFVNSILNLPFDTTEEEDNADKFVNSISFDDEEEVFLSQRMMHSINALTRSESVSAFWENSDTDAEVVSAQYGYIPDTSTKSNRKGRFFQDDLDSSSGDSTHARPLEINRTKLGSSASTLKTCKTQYQPRSAYSVSQRAGTRRFQSHRKISTKGAFHEAQKETLEHSNNKRGALVTDERNALKGSSSESSGVNRRRSLIQLEKPPSSQNLSPPSVYFCNVVVGLFLFVVIIWEILSYGKFC